MGGIFKQILGGGSKSAPTPVKSATVAKAEKRQAADIVKIEKKERQQEEALTRKRKGRGTLVSGSELGINSTDKPTTRRAHARANTEASKTRRRRRPRDRSSLLSGSELGIQKRLG